MTLEETKPVLGAAKLQARMNAHRHAEVPLLFQEPVGVDRPLEPSGRVAAVV
ncbi:MAG: hypothetical protein ABI409_09790 [Ramlibacter sp.]